MINVSRDYVMGKRIFLRKNSPEVPHPNNHPGDRIPEIRIFETSAPVRREDPAGTNAVEETPPGNLNPDHRHLPEGGTNPLVVSTRIGTGATSQTDRSPPPTRATGHHRGGTTGETKAQVSRAGM